MTAIKTKIKNRKILIILISVCVLLIALAIAATLAILPLFSMDHIKNTSDALLFDISKITEIMSGNAFEISAEFDIPKELTELRDDFHLAIGSAQDKNNRSGKADLSFSMGDNSLAFDLLYDTETVVLSGLGTDPSAFVSLPRRNLKEAFDSSQFFYVSGSMHSMNINLYNELVPTLDSSLDPDREIDTEALSKIADDVIKIAEPISSFVFSKGKLCREYTCSLDAEKAVKIIGLFAEIDETQIQALKDSIGKKAVSFTYVTDGKYITSANIISDTVKTDIEFVYDRNTNGFNANGIIEGTECELKYSRTVSDTEFTADLTLVSQNSDSLNYSFKLNKNDSSYTLKLNGKDIADGICELDTEKLRLTVTDPVTDSDLVSFLLKKEDSIVTEIPVHRSIFDMSEDELTEFFRNIPIKTASDILKSIADIDLSAYMTADSKLMMHTDKIMSEATKLYGPYVSLLKSTEKKLLDTVSKIYVWNDRLESYILFTYLRDTDSLEIGVAYELTDDILAEYHIATLTENDIMYVHSVKQIEKIDPTCDTAGKEVYNCERCDYGYEIDHKPLGHQINRINIVAQAHDGYPVPVTATLCSRCGIFSRLSSSDYFSLELTPHKNGGYTISKFDALKKLGFSYLYLPPLLNEDIKFSAITVTQPDDSFEAINIPEGVEKLDASSIYLSDSFKVLVLPSSLKEIANSAFYGSGKPSVILFSGNQDAWNNIRLNEYFTLWAETEIIFCPDGVTHEDVSKRLFLSSDIENAIEKQKQMILTVEAARKIAENDRVTLISEKKIAHIDYDEENSLIAYCGISVGFKTQIEIFDVKSGKIIDSFEVNDHINKLAIREGYIAMGGDYSTTVYVYDIFSKETVKFKFDTGNTLEGISQIFIDSGYVYASTANSYYLVSYSIRDGKVKSILQPMNIDRLIMNHQYHRLIAVEKFYSQIYLNLIDTEKADFINEITFSENKTSSLVKIPIFENVIVTDLGTVYDFDGNVSTEKPLNTPLVTTTVPDGLPIVSKLYEDIDGAMTLFAESGQKVYLALQSVASDTPIILDYYADKAIVTKDGDMIIYTPNNYGLLLVKLT
ncbi:MAG: hypothetical protein J6S71_10970 [Clostridia bacterium]|nr:hypothetical protein [Clostridia bacterium]